MPIKRYVSVVVAPSWQRAWTTTRATRENTNCMTKAGHLASLFAAAGDSASSATASANAESKGPVGRDRLVLYRRDDDQCRPCSR